MHGQMIINHLGSTAYVTDQSQNITQGFLYAPFGEIISEYQGIAPNSALPKYAFNAKELDEETGMYYYEVRYMAPPTFISRDPLFEQKPWLTPYHYCSNNPTNKVDPTGMFDDEAQANKYHERAVKKYGSERVGDVYNAGNSENPNYQFRIYDKGKEKDKQWTSVNEKNISVCAYKGNSISTGKDYRKYKHTQGDGILTVKTSLTLGAQAGGTLKGKGVSLNLGSIDVASINFGTGQKIRYSHVNEYGEATHRMGVSLGFVGYNYTKEPYQDANHTLGYSYKKSVAESFLGINREEIDVSFGIAIIFGINIDVNYKW